VRLALNKHIDIGVEIFGRASFEIRASFAPIAIEFFIGLFHTIDWKLYKIYSALARMTSIMDLK